MELAKFLKINLFKIFFHKNNKDSDFKYNWTFKPLSGEKIRCL